MPPFLAATLRPAITARSAAASATRASAARALANWTSAARRELERRGEWHPEKLPPYSM
jgi:hypothetical protein